MGANASKQRKRELQGEYAALKERVLAMDKPALAAWLDRSRRDCLAAYTEFRKVQTFEEMQRHGAAQAAALGHGAAEGMMPLNASLLNTIEQLETRCGLLERVLELPRQERVDPTGTVQATGLAFSKYHDVYHDLEGRGSACAAHRDDLARKWMQVPGDSDDGRRLLRDALAWHELVVLARQVDASKPL